MGTSGWQGAGTPPVRSSARDAEIQAIADAFYNAASDESLIHEATRRACDCMNAGRAVLMVRPGAFTAAPTLFVPINFEQSSLDLYREYYYQTDLWSRVGEEQQHPTGTVLRGDDMIETDRFEKSEFYADYLKPFDMPKVLTSVIERSPTTLVNLSLLRGHGQPDFEDPDVRAFEALQPAIRTATRSLLMLRKLSARSEAVLQAVMKIGQAVVLINARGEEELAETAEELRTRTGPSQLSFL